jgi:hypothetical protein
MQGDFVSFATTGITHGALVRGIRFFSDGATSESIVIRASSCTIRANRAEHRIKKLEQVYGATDSVRARPALATLAHSTFSTIRQPPTEPGNCTKPRETRRAVTNGGPPWISDTGARSLLLYPIKLADQAVDLVFFNNVGEPDPAEWPTFSSTAELARTIISVADALRWAGGLRPGDRPQRGMSSAIVQ